MMSTIHLRQTWSEMIVERLELTVPTGRESDFEAALSEARHLISQVKGFAGLTAARGVERPSTYLILIRWETIEAHLVGFRESDLFPQWRALVGPFFAEPPLVEHFTERPTLTQPS